MNFIGKFACVAFGEDCELEIIHGHACMQKYSYEEGFTIRITKIKHKYQYTDIFMNTEEAKHFFDAIELARTIYGDKS